MAMTSQLDETSTKKTGHSHVTPWHQLLHASQTNLPSPLASFSSWGLPHPHPRGLQWMWTSVWACVVVGGQGRKTGCVLMCVSMQRPQLGKTYSNRASPTFLSYLASKQHPPASLTQPLMTTHTMTLHPRQRTHTHTHIKIGTLMHIGTTVQTVHMEDPYVVNNMSVSVCVAVSI